MLSYQIDDNGILPTLSSLAGILTIEQVLELPAPDGKKYEVVNKSTSDTINISAEDLIALTKYTNVSDRLRANLAEDRSVEARRAINTLKTILESGKTQVFIAGAKSMSAKSLSFRVAQLVRLLNRHSHSNIDLKTDKALKNQVVNGIWNVCTDPENQIIASSPIEMEEARNAAASSEAGEAARHASMDVPTTKFLMQVQNLVGKQCIGITAVSVKQFFANSTYETRKIDTLIKLVDNLKDDEPREKFLSILKTMEKINPVTGEVTMLANINLEPLINKLQNKGWLYISDPEGRFAARHYSGTQFNVVDYLKEKLKLTSEIDAALNSSGLLSAATDNAKELILAKLNATPKLIDVYTYLTSLGVSFMDIANIMTSPLMNYVSKMLNANMFNSAMSYMDVEKTMRFFIDGSVFGTTDRVLKYLIARDKLNVSDWKDAVNDRNIIEAMLNAAYSARANLLGTKSIEDYLDGMDEEYSGETISVYDLTRCITYLNACKDRIDIRYKLNAQIDPSGESDWSKGVNILEMLVEKVLPGTKEQSMLGAMLGINQGMDTSPYDHYKLFRRVEQFVNDRFGDKVTEPFNMLRFLNDDEYRNEMINLYESVKTNTNILGVIADVPHFAAMFKTLGLNSEILTRLSAKYEATQSLAREIEDKRPIRDSEFKQVQYYIGERIMVDWITSSQLAIILPPEFEYYRGGERKLKTPNTKQLSILTLDDIATFKVWFEDFAIPELKKRFPGSRFLKEFSRSAKLSEDKKKIIEFYKLPIDMQMIDDSVKIRAMYDDLLTDFDEVLAAQEFYGWNIADLFFLYNLVVNKDGFSKNSLTRFFENLVGSPRSSKLINNYYQYISNLDSDKELRSAFINSVLNDTSKEDVKSRIQKRVRNSYIKPKTQLADNTDGNATFDMPSLRGSWHVKMQIDPNKIPKQVILRPISKKSALQEMASIVNNHVQEMEQLPGSGKVILCSQAKINDLFANDAEALCAPAFIHAGRVYVNQDIAKLSDLTHEFAHMVLADLRWNPDKEVREKYYALVSSITNHPNYNMIAANYKHRIGADLNEEVLATVVGNWIGNRIRTEWGGNDEIEALVPEIVESVKRLFGIDSLKGMKIQDIATYDIDTICSYFGSHIFNSDWTSTYSPEVLVKTQVVAGLKKTLHDIDWLKLVC